ncbi:lysine-specific demethylase 5A-like isoform X2 [Clavelina lepadiformis]|uniref:lysine-specific demethylase 5A-like isoform X2 n=1 Tax=Clavelina lepadiformis TaxID=159417 RepID=UPI0040410545
MIDDEFFPPPECPVFEPNEEEFADPLSYINKIRPIAEKAGICKIRPPPYWQPPFAIDVENFKFTPRVQRINELGIHTRIRLQFIESVARFWELQGNPFKLPHVGGRALDLYGLHEVVKNFGGFQEVCRRKQWNNVCTKLHLPKNFSTALRMHYDRILYPFDIMKSGILVKALESSEDRESVTSHLKMGNMKSKKRTMYQGSSISLDNLFPTPVSVGSSSTPKQRIKRRPVEEPLIADVSNNKELAKLQLYGAGPKMMGLGVTAENKNGSAGTSIDKCTAAQKEVSSPVAETVLPTRTVQTRDRGNEQIPYSILDTMDNCKLCGKDSNDSLLLLCDGCDDSYHTYCLIPPLPNVPAGDWRCPKCISKECNKKVQAYGFEQARREYTLQSFGEMADTFKSEYFNKPVHMVPTGEVEQEFWRLVGSLDEDLAVEYGADIHVVDNGSGFPRLIDKEHKDLTSEEEEYATSKWNLNNLPVQEQSLLHSVSGDISGMKIPWVYVGMCFSAFCWHTEDHWTYSINYMHWGEPKTWYGVPREDACKFEHVMQESAPELFNNHPDLLHHLVTTMNPSTLLKRGVRVVRTNQCAGEFMITFPRAYHAGFNQGYNFAEAVNFCPADWVPVGRECVAHYRKMRKCCVFSHEEIICKVAHNPDDLDVQVAAVIYKDMLIMLQDEKELRKHLLSLGVEKAEREAFELVPDDERQCLHCRTTCFLSAVTCTCTPENMVCLRHVDKLCEKCSASQFVLRYRYSLDELPPILHKLKVRAEAFDAWGDKVKAVLVAKEKKLTLKEIKELLQESESGNFPENDLLQRLKSVVHEAEICSRVSQQLVGTKRHRTRIRDPSQLPEPSKCTLTIEEIQAFCKQIKNLPCAIPFAQEVADYTKQVEAFIRISEESLSKDEPSSEEIVKLLEDASEFDLDLPQIALLQQAMHQARWLEEVRERLLLEPSIPQSAKINVVTLEHLKRLINSGMNIAPKRSVERAMSELKELLALAEGWEDKAKMCLTSKPSVSLATAVLVTEKAGQIPVCLPQCMKLLEVVNKARAWISKIENLQTQDFYPYVEVLEALAKQAHSLHVKLEQLQFIDTQVTNAKSWKERASKTFLKKNTPYSLNEVLNPRKKVASVNMNWKRRKSTEVVNDQKTDEETKLNTINVHDPPDPVQVVVQYKQAEKNEMNLIKQIRLQNNTKVGSTMRGSSSDPGSDSKEAKKTTPEDSVLYCVCRKPSSGLMLQCEVCHDWFHTTCVPLPKLSNAKSKVEQVFELKFLCPMCRRSRRPHLSTILSLLLQLQKLPVRIKEGEALQCLTERAMSWQDRARQTLSSKDYQDLLKTVVSDCSFVNSNACPELFSVKRDNDGGKIFPLGLEKKIGKTETRDSVDEAIDAVIKQSLENNERTQLSSTTINSYKCETNSEDLRCANQGGSLHASDSSEKHASVNEDSREICKGFSQMYPVHSPAIKLEKKNGEAQPKSPLKQSPPSVDSSHSNDIASEKPVQIKAEIGKATPGSTIETSLQDDEIKDEVMDAEIPIQTQHKASPNNGSLISYSGVSSNKSFVKSDKIIDNEIEGLVDSNTQASNKDMAVPALSVPMKARLEELMLEGDLLEVTLPETQWIWKVLQATQPRKDESFVALLEEEKKELNERRKKKKEGLFPDKKKKSKSNLDEKETKQKPEKRRKRVDAKQNIISTKFTDDDEYAFCSVEIGTEGRQSCLQPVGEEVDWLQCDGGCEQWFHCVCVKISASEASECEYVCDACRKQKENEHSGTSMNNSEELNIVAMAVDNPGMTCDVLCTKAAS